MTFYRHVSSWLIVSTLACLLRHQMPLPETALELCAVANGFAPVKGDVDLGQNASETKIKALSDSGELAKYHILHFAAHDAW